MIADIPTLRSAALDAAFAVSPSRCGIYLPADPDRYAVLRAIEAWRAWYGQCATVSPADRAPLTALARLLVAVCEASP